jgi:hypothetical protein
MNAPIPKSYTVKAHNISHASENKIHDDAVARQLGFAGGLVPGVEVYAYTCHLPVQRWGRAWLERGQMECRFLKPVYDGHLADVTASDNGGAYDLILQSQDELCSTAEASLPEKGGEAPPLHAYPFRAPPAERPPANEKSLALNTWLGTKPFRVTPEMAADYLRDIGETDPIYASEGLVHPGQLLRLCNLALRENVVLQPWVHTFSKVTNFAVARVGDELSARARVAANYDRKGHRMVDLDVALIANDKTVISHVLHTAAYRLRQLSGR